MTRGVRLYLVGSFVLVSLAGCGRGFFQSAEREPWRAEAEIACLKSGAVKESPELVRIDPISGPGVCGAEFPLKVAALGEGGGTFGFADELRPPANIGNQPRWPIQPAPASSQAPYPDNALRQPNYAAPSNGPISLTAPGVACAGRRNRSAGRGHAGAAALYGRTGLSAARPLFGACSTLSPPYSAPYSQPPAASLAAARSRAGQFRYGGRSGRGQAGGDAGLSDRLRARSLARRFRAAGGAALVRRARGRDQADLRLFLPRHERQSERAYFRARLRQRARYRGLHARRRPAHLGEGRLEGHAGRAGLSARRAGRRLPAVQHRAGAGLQRLSLRSHPRRSDAPRLAAASSASRPRASGEEIAARAGGAQPLRLARTLRDGIARRHESLPHPHKAGSKVNEEDEFEDD